jgi:hypothetical protein
MQRRKKDRYLIIARLRNDCGAVMSSILEILRLMISSTFVVCTTGRLGRAPLKTPHLQRVGRPI